MTLTVKEEFGGVGGKDSKSHPKQYQILIDFQGMFETNLSNQQTRTVRREDLLSKGIFPFFETFFKYPLKVIFISSYRARSGVARYLTNV